MVFTVIYSAVIAHPGHAGWAPLALAADAYS